MGDVKKFVSLEKLNLNNEYVKKYVGTKNAGNFKAAKFDSATKTLKLYKKADPSDEDTADFELVIPDPDVSSLMGKVTTATADNIAVFDENGNVKDSGKTLVNYVTKTELASASADHLTKTVVTKEELDALVATPSTAHANVIYLLKDDNAVGDDKYKEYTLIGDAVICIGDTSVDFSDVAKATEVNIKFESVETRLTALEGKVGDGFAEITEDEIKQLWEEA